MFAPAVFHQDDEQYLTTANENTMLIAQIESRLGCENCEEIAAVDGVGKLTVDSIKQLIMGLHD